MSRAEERVRALTGRTSLVVMCGALALFCLSVPVRGRLSDAIGAGAAATAIDLVLYNLVYVAAAVAVLAHRPSSRREAWGWRTFAVGLMSSVLGNAWYSIVLLRLPEVPYPSAADAMWLLWYPACYAGIVLTLTAHVGRFPLSVWLDGLVAGSGAAAVAAALWFRPLTAVDPGTPALTVVTSMAYPVFDLLLLVMLVGVLAVLRTAARGWVLLLAAGFAATGVTDVVSAVQTLDGTYAEGGWVDAGWLVGVVLLASAAWRSRDTEPVDAAHLFARHRGGSLQLLLVPSLSAVASLLLLGAGQGDRFPPVAGVFACACILGAGARAALSFRELGRFADVHREARTDDLTRLPNRRALYEEFERVLPAGVREGGSTALLLIDLDGFKDVNDSLGHDVGDQLLIAVAHRFRDLLGPGQFLARLGGDEFAVLLAGADEHAGGSVARDLVRAVQEPFDLGATWLTVDASIGVATTTAGAEGRADLLRTADAAMYAAKGTPQRVCTSEGTEGRGGKLAEARLLLLSHLRDGLVGSSARRASAGRIEVLLQPKIHLATGTLSGVEALARWREPDGSMLMPAEFLPLMGRAGLLPALADEVLRASIAAGRRLADAGGHAPVAVNLSAVDVQELGLALRLTRLLAEADLSPAALTVELTEDSLVTDPERVATVLSAVRDAGVKVSLDDFGTGYSSLSYLRTLPVDEVKLDRSFILSATADPTAEAVIRHTVGLVHALGLTLVAEGVEDAATADLMLRLGCDEGQGFFWARPMSIEDLLLSPWLAATPVTPEPPAQRQAVRPGGLAPQHLPRLPDARVAPGR